MRKNLAIIAFVLLAACIGVIAKTVVQKSTNPNSARTTSIPQNNASGYVEFTGTLDDVPVVDGNRNVDLREIAKSTPASAPIHLDRDELGAVTRWRYDRCLSDAADKPTEQGVSVALYLCREKFLRKDS